MRVSCNGVEVCIDRDGRSVRLVSGLTFSSDEHEFLSIVGPSGCGKTTLLRMIAGLLQPTGGELKRLEESPGRPVAMVAQEQNLFPWMTALDNAGYGMRMQGIERKERNRRSMELLARLGLAGRQGAWPHELSLGMKQRIAVARAFLSNPGLLLMDEPFSALDAQMRATLQMELLSLWESERTPVLFVTHDVEEAILLSQRILVFSEAPGRILAEVRVPFSYPRPFSLTLTDEFLELKRLLHAHLGHHWAVEHVV
jgi:NitT/TauT family transport system ATP-binding protein